MWIGTEGGLVRYDGNEFTTFNTSNGLIGNNVWSITEDENGDLWLGCYGAGISKFDGRNFTNYDTADGLVHSSVRLVKYSKKFGTLLIGTSHGFSVLKDSVFHNFSKENTPDKLDMLVTAIEEKDSNIYVYCFIYRNYLISPGNSYEIRFQDSIYYNELHSVSSLKTFSDSMVVVGSDRSGASILKSDTVIHFPGIGQVFGIAADYQKNIWFGSWNDGNSPPGGLYRYDGREIVSMNEAFGIYSQKGWTLFYDNDTHLLWYGTLDKGLYQIPPLIFSYFTPKAFGLDVLSANDLLIDHHNRLWIAYDSGVILMADTGYLNFKLENFITSRVEYDRKHFQRDNQYLIDSKGSYQKYKRLLEQGLVKFNPYYTSLFKDTAIATSLYNPDQYQKKKSEVFSNRYKKQLKSKFVNFKCMDTNSKGEIFVASLFGQSRFNETQKKFEVYFPYGAREFCFTPEDTLVQSDNWAISTSIIPETDKNWEIIDYKFKQDNAAQFVNKIIRIGNEIWLTSNTDGLFLYNKGAFTSFIKMYPQLNKNIADVCSLESGSVAAGGSNGIVYLFSKENGKYILKNEIGKEQGLVGNAIKWLYKYQNFLLVGTNSGLNVIDYSVFSEQGKVICQFFDQADGYHSSRASHPAEDNSGNLYLISEKGLLKIDLELLVKKRKYNFPLRLQKIYLYNRQVSWDTILTSKVDAWTEIPEAPVRFGHDQNYLVFEFCALNYYGSEKLALSYKMEGIDVDWAKASKNRMAVYANLGPGQYTFQVKAQNKLSGSEIPPLLYHFSIETPWWKSWWFYTLLVLVVISAIIAALYIKTKMVRREEAKKSEVQKQIAEIEITALQSQINPHFIFNSLNSIQNFILDSDTDHALSYLADFSYVLRQALESANQKLIPLNNELNYLKKYLKIEQMRFFEKFNLQLDIDENIDLDETDFPPMIVQPFVENAIKHGLLPKESKGNLLIKFYKKNDLIICEIEDDGIGRQKAKELNSWLKGKHSSRGISLTKKRLELLAKFFKNENFHFMILDLTDGTKPTGTKVIITVPDINLNQIST